jgi:hypothetical protein
MVVDETNYCKEYEERVFPTYSRRKFTCRYNANAKAQTRVWCGGGVYNKSSLSIFAYAYTTSFLSLFFSTCYHCRRIKLCLINMLTSSQESPTKTIFVQTYIYNKLLFVITFIGSLPIIVWDWELEIAIVDAMHSSTRARTSKTQHKLKLGTIGCHLHVQKLTHVSRVTTKLKYGLHITWCTVVCSPNYGIWLTGTAWGGLFLSTGLIFFLPNHVTGKVSLSLFFQWAILISKFVCLSFGLGCVQEG